MGIFHSIKKSRRVSSDIDEKIEYLNKELEKTGLREAMTTSGMYFGSQEIPGIPAENADVPDSTGVLGSDFTPPIGGNGNPNDPSNYPDAYDTAWMYNSNDVDGETNRPIVATLDPSLIAAFNAANPGSSQFPAGGAGIVFGSSGFGTGVGYAKAGHFYQVLNPGLFGNGSTKLVPPGSPFSAPWFGLFGLYFPATPELAEIVMAMTGAYTDAGGYNPQGALQILLWRNHNRFHDGPFNEWTGKKYTDSETGQNYILQTFYLHQKGNQYEKTPAVPPTSIVIQRNDLGDPNFLPINIDLGEISPEGFNYLSGRAGENNNRGKGETGEGEEKTTKIDGEMDGEEGEDPRIAELLNDAKRTDKFNEKLARDLTFKDPRNLNAAVGVVIVGGYFTAKSLYAYLAALAVAGYSYSQLQRAEQDFQPIIWKSQTWSGGDAKDYTVNTDLIHNKDAGDVADMEAAQGLQDLKDKHDKAREQDQKEAKEASDKVNQAGEALERNPSSANEKAYQKALEKQQEIMNRNVKNKKARRDEYKNAEEKRELDRNRRNFEQQRKREGLSDTFKPQGKVLSEDVGLGHFEPEQLNVNIEDLRKGIMPEFPKDPPPEMVNGYNPKSRLAPKKLERSSFIKVTKKDLAKYHVLKDSEIKDFMDKINAVNDFIKKHPEELVYAQTRYPKSDPRLARLNWEMDQKLNASKEYMDKHYPENQKLFGKIQKSIKKNIELTDPKSFKGVKIPKFEGVDLMNFKRRKEVVSRHYKKAVRVKKLFSRKKT